MPSDKRARQRAARQAKMAELERRRKRRTAVRRGLTLVVVAGLVVLVVVLTTGGSSKKSAGHKTGTTTTSASSTQAALDAKAVAAGCPSNPHTKLSKPSWSSAPALTIDTAKTYTATVTTDVGPFTIALDAAAAPHTVNNFVFLAQHGFYNCVIFHRVIPGFMDQTGDPTGTGTGGPGYQFADENIPKSYSAGDVAMANSGPNTNGSQFFVLVSSYSTASYSLFGHVTAGMSVVQAINKDGDATSGSGTDLKVIHRILKVTVSTS